MQVTWGDMQTGLFEVLLDDRFFDAGAVVEACSVGGYVHFIPTDPATGAMLIDQRTGDWAVRTKQGKVQIVKRRPGERLS